MIGLFGIIGIAGVTMGPIGGRVIDKLVPWYASLVSIFMLLIFQAIQTGAGGIHVAAVIIATFGLDVFRQTLQVSLTTAIFGWVPGVSLLKLNINFGLSRVSIDPAARARLNAVNILWVCFFVPQLCVLSGQRSNVHACWSRRFSLAKSWALQLGHTCSSISAGGLGQLLG